MTRPEALRKAEARSMTSRFPWLVICKTDHPSYPGEDYYYAISEADKHAWTPGEHVVDTFDDGESVG